MATAKQTFTALALWALIIGALLAIPFALVLKPKKDCDNLLPVGSEVVIITDQRPGFVIDRSCSSGRYFVRYSAETGRQQYWSRWFKTFEVRKK